MIPAGTRVTVRTTNGGELTLKLAQAYAPTTYLSTQKVVLVREYEDGRSHEIEIPGYRIKSIEEAA